MRRRFLYKKTTTVFSKEYFTIKALEDGLTVKLSNNTSQYSINGGDWISLASSATTPAIKKGQTVQFKINNPTISSSYGIGTFTISKKCDVSGNIMSLLYGDDFAGKTDLTGKNGAFYKLLYSCKTLQNAENLILPATTLANSCYNNMFQGCTSLATAPALPATTLAYACYISMFRGCSALTTAPELPATTLANDCYSEMFSSCNSLAIAPELPATTLASRCYYGMFKYCISLTTAPELSATKLADSCYQNMFQNCTSLATTAPELPATTLTSQCYSSMFNGCSALTTAPELPATTLASYCYNSMFYNCTSLTVAPALPATTLASDCYASMFRGCSALTTAPELPATNLAGDCYSSMFNGCSALTTAPELPATTLANSCYSSMFYGTDVLPDCSNIDFTSESVVQGGGLKSLFAGTKVTDEDLMEILPINSSTGKYYLPATTLANSCYSSMFNGCSALTTAPELPATTLANSCYSSMFNGCSALTTAPELPATELADYCYLGMFSNCTSLTTAPELPATALSINCYQNMFQNCTNLTTAPELPATTLSYQCYYYMFQNCSKLNYIKMLATNISASNCLTNWVSGVASSGTFVKNVNMTSLPSGTSGIPTGWTVEDNITLLDCVSLEITADNVNGRKTNTTIYYTAQVNAVDDSGNSLVVTKTGTAVSGEFPQNTSETETVERTITFTYMGVTATTTIIQGVWRNQNYRITLNDQWQVSTKPNPDSSLYDGVYESFSNKGVNSTAATMYIDIVGYTDFNLYIRSYAESNYDYVMVSQLDQSINNNTSYNNTTLVKSHTKGKQTSGTDISNYTHVQFTNIDGEEHRITIVYRKDSSSNVGDDKGYVLIEKQ